VANHDGPFRTFAGYALTAGCSPCVRDEPVPQTAVSTAPVPVADPQASRDDHAADAIPDSKLRPIMQAQVVPDRPGCIRLTNWDAARLAMMVRPGTKVLFEA
jgi:hypothetical protein